MILWNKYREAFTIGLSVILKFLCGLKNICQF